MNSRRTLHCRTVAGGRFRLDNHIRDLPPVTLEEPGGLPTPDPTAQPLELLLASLGSCLAGTIRANAAARGITLQELELDLEADLAAAQTDDLYPPSLGIDEIRVAIHISADAPREMLATLVARATLRSQVASTLHDGTELTVTLSAPAGS